jgi:hypothetical protein
MQSNDNTDNCTIRTPETWRFRRIACFHHQDGILSRTEKEQYKLGVGELKMRPEEASDKTRNGGVRNCHNRPTSANYSANHLNLGNEKLKIKHHASRRLGCNILS